MGRCHHWSAEQQAIGELMVDPDSPEGGPPHCLSYPAFWNRMRNDAEFARWLRPLLDDIDELMATAVIPSRLAAGRDALDELIAFLDKGKVWLPWSRSDSAA